MVLVTGGTGLVGSHLLLRLLQSSTQVRAIFRSSESLQHVLKVFGYYTQEAKVLFDRIEWVKADILDLPALEEAFNGVQQVYHAAALITFDPRKLTKLQKINAEGTANVVNLCAEHGVKKLCHVSTIGTIGQALDGSQATEETAWNTQHANVYAISKYQAEMEVWRGSQEGLDVVIINPGVILGPGYWSSGSGKFFEVAYREKGFYPPGGTGFVAVENVVASMVALMATDIKNERFILVDENLSYVNVLGQLANHMHRKPPKRKLKFWQLRIAQFFDWVLGAILKKERGITNDTLYALQNRSEYDNSKIKNSLDIEFVPLTEAMAFCCQCYLQDLE
jgi:nucleoside-diphosphate-sugar epimerase